MSEFTLILAGDVMTGRGIDQAMARPVDPALAEPWVRDARHYLAMARQANGPIATPIAAQALWGCALPWLRDAAATARIANLETAITARGVPWPGKAVHYRMHPDNAGCLTAAGFDVLSLANNHALDWGDEGLLDTLARLRALGVLALGAAADAAAAWRVGVWPLAGGARLLMVGCAIADSGVPAAWRAGPGKPGVALFDSADEAGADALLRRLERVRRPGDRALVSIHWGANRVPAIPEAHRVFAHRLIDSGGVDLIHGHSAHHPLPAEIRDGKLILYGCGDLINDYEGIGGRGGPAEEPVALYRATLSLRDGRLLRLRVLPMRVQRFRLAAAGPRELARMPPSPEGLSAP